ncbi:hypothetical protein [Natronococcus wangiae]|uniref:hypothetical protein n=1 Tax=Natronococcus wangiae TaxID=3068275 RepID=UPI00273F578C|nr:hypothetical protein [Natronococcus sp. AD5]
MANLDDASDEVSGKRRRFEDEVAALAQALRTADDERLVDAEVSRCEPAVHFPNGEREKPDLERAPDDIDPETDAKALFLERARE